MSSEDRVRPFHSKSDGSGQEAADAVAAVLKQAADHEKARREKEKPKKQPKWMLPLGINLAVFAIYLLVFSPSWVTVHPIQGPPPERQEADLRRAIFLQAGRIDDYRERHGSLPDDLEDAGSPTPGVRYVREGDGYQLVGTAGAAELVYDSHESPAQFLGPAADRLSGG